MSIIHEVGPIVKQWSAPRRIPAQKLGRRSTASLAQVRAEMRQCITDHLSAGKPGLLIVTAPPGTGKSTIALQVAEQIAERTGTLVAQFGTRHDQFDAVKRSQDWLHCQGRGPGNCTRPDIAYTVAAKGWRVSDLVCSANSIFDVFAPGYSRRCPVDRNECVWWQQWQGDAHRFMPSEHLMAAKLWDRPGLRIVFDELDAKHFAPKPVYLGLAAFPRWRNVWPELADVLQPLISFLAGSDGRHLTDGMLHDALAPTLPDLPDLQLDLPESDAADLETWASGLPDGRIKEFLTTLYGERARHLNGKRFVSRIVAYNHKLVLHLPPDLPAELFDHPAVLLNATADVAGLRHLLERDNYPVTIYSPDVALDASTSVEYVLDANHSKRAVSNDNHGYRRRWLRRLGAALTDSKRALVVATIDGERMLENALADLFDGGRVVLAHYAAVSGLNSFDGCDVVVLSQVFNPPPAAVGRLFRRIYGGMVGEPLDLRTCYRSATVNNGDEAWQVTVTSMADERLAAIYERWRWAEMYQAAHRVRPILHGRRIVVLCAIPLGGLEPTKITYSKTQTRKVRTMDKLQTAILALIDEQGYATRGDVARVAGVDKSTVGRYWSDVLEQLDLRTIEIAVPSAYYPSGRKTEAVVLS